MSHGTSADLEKACINPSLGMLGLSDFVISYYRNDYHFLN